MVEVYKLLKSGGSTSFSVKENTKIKCICYINNMFSKIFINQAFKSYTTFDFRYTYTCYRFKIIKLRWYLPSENYLISLNCGGIYPLKITKFPLKPLNVHISISKNHNYLVKHLWRYSKIIFVVHFRGSH